MHPARNRQLGGFYQTAAGQIPVTCAALRDTTVEADGDQALTVAGEGDVSGLPFVTAAELIRSLAGRRLPQRDRAVIGRGHHLFAVRRTGSSPTVRRNVEKSA